MVETRAAKRRRADNDGESILHDDVVDKKHPPITFECSVCRLRKPRASQLTPCQVGTCKITTCKICVERWGFRSRAVCCGQEMGHVYWEGTVCPGCKVIQKFDQYEQIRPEGEFQAHETMVECKRCEFAFCYDCGASAAYTTPVCVYRALRKMLWDTFGHKKTYSSGARLVQKRMPERHVPAFRKVRCMWAIMKRITRSLTDHEDSNHLVSALRAACLGEGSLSTGWFVSPDHEKVFRDSIETLGLNDQIDTVCALWDARLKSTCMRNLMHAREFGKRANDFTTDVPAVVGLNMVSTVFGDIMRNINARVNMLPVSDTVYFG